MRRFRLWSRPCEYCGAVKTVVRHVSASAPRGVHCDVCGAEHPRIASLSVPDPYMISYAHWKETVR